MRNIWSLLTCQRSLLCPHADSGWNKPALIDALMNGLSETKKDHLAPLELPQDLEAIIAISICVDNRLQESGRERQRTAVPTGIQPSSTSSFPMLTGSGKTVPPQGSEELKQLGRTKISSKERQHHLQEGCCFYCGQLGHQLANCLGKDQAHQPGGGRWWAGLPLLFLLDPWPR